MTISKLSTALGAASTTPTAGRFAQISSGGIRTTYTDGRVTDNSVNDVFVAPVKQTTEEYKYL
jgi:hypothetical protein